MALFGLIGKKKEPDRAKRILDEAFAEGLLNEEEYRAKQFWLERRDQAQMNRVV
jgi:uncharacterized membrane protein